VAGAADQCHSCLMRGFHRFFMCKELEVGDSILLHTRSTSVSKSTISKNAHSLARQTPQRKYRGYIIQLSPKYILVLKSPPPKYNTTSTIQHTNSIIPFPISKKHRILPHPRIRRRTHLHLLITLIPLRFTPRQLCHEPLSTWMRGSS
jgi:hypothetical protein